MLSLGSYLLIKFKSGDKKALSEAEKAILGVAGYEAKELFHEGLAHEISEEQLIEVLKYFEENKKYDYSSRIRGYLVKNGIKLQEEGVSYLYAILDSFGRVKMGKSKHPFRRVKELQTSQAERLVCWAYWKVGVETKVAEKEAHEVLAKYRVGGEWFKLPYLYLEDLESMFPFEYERVYFNNKLHPSVVSDVVERSYDKIEWETEKAYRVAYDGESWWIPKSLLVSIDHNNKILILKKKFKYLKIKKARTNKVF